MKKKVIISVLVIMLLVISCAALVSCNVKCECDNCNNGNAGNNGDDRECYLMFHYTLTTQFTDAYNYPISSLLNKPEKPTFKDRVFNAGYGKAYEGNVADFDLPLENPRMEPGYDVDKNYYFVGWYTEPEFLYKWNFAEDRIYRDITLYARWIEM